MHRQDHGAVALGLELVGAHERGDGGDQRRRGDEIGIDAVEVLRRSFAFVVVAALCQRPPGPEVRLKEHDEQGAGRSYFWS